MRKLIPHVLKRAVCEGLESGHPWVFRDKVGDDRALRDGDWLQLMDSDGGIVGTGVYQAEGGVGIRVFRLGHRPVSVAWLQRRLEEALDRRAELRQETDAYRVLNGESDGFPGIVLDVYAGVGVLQTYTPGVDALGRYLAGQVADRLSLRSLIWKMPSKRVGGRERPNRLLRGERPYVVKFEEGPLTLAADLFAGQKSGTYLDLRGLRRFLLSQPLQGKRVLNLFAYTGMAGLACAQAGAREVINVDQAQPSLDFGRRYHKHPAMKWVAADVFAWIDGLPNHEFDLIIADPPSMASNKTQVLKALKVYHRLYSTLLEKLKPGGTIIACCCTSRITPAQFEEKVSFALRPMSRKLALPMEPDHEATFAEADYLKVLVFRQDQPQNTGRPARERGPARATGASKAQPTTSQGQGRSARTEGKPAKFGGAPSQGKAPGNSTGKPTGKAAGKAKLGKAKSGKAKSGRGGSGPSQSAGRFASGKGAPARPQGKTKPAAPARAAKKKRGR
jgi:23S rRNA (cytosine1962-C5)-methyltransferase